MNEYIPLIITGITSIVGGGGLAALIQAYWTNKRGERTDAFGMIASRIQALEKEVTECKQSHEDCRDKNRLLEREANDLRDRVLRLETDLITGVITANSDMKIIEWNQGATLMFGHLRSDVLGQSVDILVPDYLKQQHYDASSKAVNDMDAVTKTEREIVAVRNDGSEFPAHLSLTSFRNKSGEKFFSARITRPRPV